MKIINKPIPNNVLQKGWPLEKKLMENSYPEPNSGCWIWGGYANNKGYGIIYSYGIRIMAHRFSYQYFNNIILSETDLILHKCNNTFCVNPQHLTVGSQSDNMRQCFREGRGGQFYNPQRKVVKLNLKSLDVIETYYSVMEASRQNNAHQSGISNACMGKLKSYKGYAWAYVD